MKVLAVDPGEVRIGLAISDEGGMIARPFKVLYHCSRKKDVEAILDEAILHGVGCIVVGIALDMEGRYGPQARKALRLVETLRENTTLLIDTWDESGSTQEAYRKKRKDGQLDARAAAVILQEYLDGKKA